MDDMNLILDLIALGCGLYCLYTWVRLMIGKRLFPNSILVPKEKKPSDCIDEEGYIAAIRLPMAVVAIVTTLYGAFMFVNEHLLAQPVPMPWSMLTLAPVLASLVWLTIRLRRAVQDFF